MRQSAVLIDLDGVLRRWDADDVALERDCGLPPGAIREVAFAPDLIRPALTGAVADGVWRDRIADRLRSRHPGADVERAVSLWSSGCGEVDERVLALLRRVRPECKVVLVTNATTRLRSDLERLGLPDELDHVVNSAEVGTAKPDPAIFEAALRAAGTAAAEALFVDDLPVHVRAAERLGCRGHVFRGADGLADRLVEVGLLPTDAVSS